jgi:hypothetical protein
MKLIRKQQFGLQKRRDRIASEVSSGDLDWHLEPLHQQSLNALPLQRLWVENAGYAGFFCTAHPLDKVGAHGFSFGRE